MGVTGCSGEGTQTAHVTALDPRITMAAPDYYVVSRSSDLENELPTDAGQHPPRSPAYGLDGDRSASDLCIMPYLDSGGRELLFRPAWRSPQQVFADLSRIHRLLGSWDAAAISVGDMAHGFHKHASEALYRSWVKHAGLHAAWQEPTMEEIPEVQLSATPLLRQRIRCTASIRLHPYRSGFLMPDYMPDPERDRNRDPAYSNSDWSLGDRKIRGQGCPQCTARGSTSHHSAPWMMFGSGGSGPRPVNRGCRLDTSLWTQRARS